MMWITLGGQPPCTWGSHCAIVRALESMRPGYGSRVSVADFDSSDAIMEQPISYVKVGDRRPAYGKASSGYPSRVAKPHTLPRTHENPRPVDASPGALVSDNGRPRRYDPAITCIRRPPQPYGTHASPATGGVCPAPKFLASGIGAI